MQAAKKKLLAQLEETRNTVERQRLLRLLWQLDHPNEKDEQTNPRDREGVPAGAGAE